MIRKFFARILLTCLFFVVFLELCFACIDFCKYKYYSELEPLPTIKRETWYTKNNRIIHATGGIDGLTYTNSKESLANSVKNGGKVMEIDFDYTIDGYLVCYHKPKDISRYINNNFSLEDFLNTKVKGKYTPMMFKDVVEFMRNNPDIYISIDTKHEDITQVIKDVVMECKDKEILNRFIVQCFYPGEKEKVSKIYNFPEDNYIFAAYKYSKDPFKVLRVCYKENYNVVATTNGNWSLKILKLFSSKNIYVYLHTINNPEVANEAFNKGTHGIYTDFIFE